MPSLVVFQVAICDKPLAAETTAEKFFLSVGADMLE